MLRSTLKPIWHRLPIGLRRFVRAARLEYLVRRNVFESEEPEFSRLPEWLRPGDSVVDIGANFGTFTLKMSALVGETGRVFSFEPVPQTFAMLIRALSARNCRNVYPVNLACSNINGSVSMSIPDDPLTGEDLYQASISASGPSLVQVCCARIDDLPLPFGKVRLIKIDAEGHDAEVVDGAWETLCRSMPILIIEHPPDEISDRLAGLGYRKSREADSPNTVFLPPL